MSRHRASSFVRRALVAVWLVFATASSLPAQAPQTIRIANFNIQVFGTKKALDKRIMTILAQIARQFDVMAVEEFRDATGETPAVYLRWINQGLADPYDVVVGPRLGRTDSKEQYAVYYRPSVVRLVESHTVPNGSYRFERPPLVATFVAGQFDFRLVVTHIKPEDAAREMSALARVAQAARDSAEQDVIILGDFNADCTYFDENDVRHPLKAAAFHWVIDNDAQTAVQTGCTYDRIVLVDGTFGNEYVPGSAQVFRYDKAGRAGKAGKTGMRLVRQVSDHYPVFADFRISGPDDDGCPAPLPSQDRIVVATDRTTITVGNDPTRRMPC